MIHFTLQYLSPRVTINVNIRKIDLIAFYLLKSWWVYGKKQNKCQYSVSDCVFLSWLQYILEKNVLNLLARPAPTSSDRHYSVLLRLPCHIELNKGVRGHSSIFKQKHSILGLDFDFAYKELIWNKNYHFKSKNNQFINILSFGQKYY